MNIAFMLIPKTIKLKDNPSMTYETIVIVLLEYLLIKNKEAIGLNIITIPINKLPCLAEI